MSEVRIVAQERSEFGKGGARRTRRAGRVPAVLYGHGQAPRHLSLPAREVAHALRGGANTLLTIELPDGTELALPKAIQAHPIKGDLQHVDLLLVRRGEKVTVEIPITITGETAPGGMVNQDLTTISVETEATNIPDGVEVSVEGLDVGAHIAAGDLQLPSGTTLATDAEALVVGIVQSPTAEDLEGGADVETETEAAPAAGSDES